MGKAMLLGILIMIVFMIIVGDVLGGALVTWALAVPIGIILWFVGNSLGWF